MKIIGIHDGHNASACVLENGEIKFAIQAERFTYEKNQGGLPFSSIEVIKENYLSGVGPGGTKLNFIQVCLIRLALIKS